MRASSDDLDDPSREGELRGRIHAKAALKDWYQSIYKAWALALAAVPASGLEVEIGSGAGFAEAYIPGLLRTDTLPYQGIDQVVDALHMPWKDGSVRALFLLNVVHHLPDAGAFLAEAQRVLKPGGLLVVTDQHVGPISRFVLRRGHHEPFDPEAQSWVTPVEGPLAGANGALAWIVFQRDLERFHREYPRLHLKSYQTFTPTQYWLAGGLKGWTLLPKFCLGMAHLLDKALLAANPDSGSFAHSVIRKEA
jgi:SAM-dependent methyltransferase